MGHPRCCVHLGHFRSSWPAALLGNVRLVCRAVQCSGPWVLHGAATNPAMFVLSPRGPLLHARRHKNPAARRVEYKKKSSLLSRQLNACTVRNVGHAQCRVHFEHFRSSWAAALLGDVRLLCSCGAASQPAHMVRMLDGAAMSQVCVRAMF